jgi:hypothetical protein
MVKTLGAFALALAIALCGALFVDVESDEIKNGFAQVMAHGLSGLSRWAAVGAIARPYASVICVLVLPPLLESWGHRLLGSKERGSLLARYSLIAALILAGFWHHPACR